MIRLLSAGGDKASWSVGQADQAHGLDQGAAVWTQRQTPQVGESGDVDPKKKFLGSGSGSGSNLIRNEKKKYSYIRWNKFYISVLLLLSYFLLVFSEKKHD